MISNTFRTVMAFAGLVLAIALVPASAFAQQQTDGPVAAPQHSDGPVSVQAGISASLATSASAAYVPQQERSMGNGTNVAMMIVGGTALIVGLSVGGDGGQIIAISGAVIGLIGMFRYLR